MTVTEQEQLLKAAAIAAMTIKSMYDWLDSVEKAGGTTSIEGISTAHAMFKSMRANKARLDRLVVEPLNAMIEKIET